MSKFFSLSALGCLLCALSLASHHEGPAIAISCGKTPLTGLPEYQQSVDSAGFKDLLSSLWNEDTKLVVVAEDELSLEDFTVKGSNGHSSFQLFENTADRRFFPSVDQPEEAFEMLSKNGFSLKTYNKDTYKNSSGKIIALVDLNDINNHDGSRHNILQRHNSEISLMFNNLCQQYTNVVLMLYGKLNPLIEETKESNAHHLVTRHLMAVTSSNLIIVDEKKKSIIYSSSYPLLSINNEPKTELQAYNSDVTLDDSRDGLLKVGTSFLYKNDKIILRFIFVRPNSFEWELKEIVYVNGVPEIPLSPQQPVKAQLSYPYISEGPVVFKNETVELIFNNKFQVQPWLQQSSGNAKFDDPQGPDLFTAPILAGLFVTSLMLLIVTWGIIMIMDIKTMDRFDDPKGKTISINVVE